MKRRSSLVRSLCGLTMLGGLLFALTGLSPKQETKQATKEKPTLDKISITEFSIQPNPPRAGGNAVLHLALRNTSNQPISVNWQIWTDNVIKWQGTVSFAYSGKVAPVGPVTLEQYKEIRNSWTAMAGPREFVAVVDDSNTLGAPEVGRRNNRKTLAFEVPLSKVPETRMQTRAINYDLAQQAGAGFNKSKDGNNPCARLVDERDFNPTSANFGLSCTNCPGGERANFELFKDFELKNGWTVQSFELDMPCSYAAHFGCRLDASPSPRSTRPYTKLHFWADAGFGVSRLVRIFIVGPADKDPYR